VQQLSGAWPTMITPFDENLQVDFGAYRAMLAWYLERRAGGLYANCLSGEMFHLTPVERLLLAREAVQAAGGRLPVAATGNLGATFDEHLHHCRQLAQAGVNVVMLVVPEFYDQEADLERYYMTVAELVPAPLGLYECPAPRPFHLSVGLVSRLARSGRFVAYKETSCNLEKIKAHLRACAGTPLALLQANTPYLLEAVRAGAPGAMSIASIWLPELVAEVIELAQRGDPAAEARHARLCALELAQRSVHPLGSKYLLCKRGLPLPVFGRSGPKTLSSETVAALDYAARAWLDEGGELPPRSSDLFARAGFSGL
jgi:4-hydroxy-tetrahydrodipicolinate synthase